MPKMQERGIVAAALRGMEARSPHVKGRLALHYIPTEPEHMLHVAAHGKPTPEPIRNLARRYSTTNGALLKVCSLIREHTDTRVVIPHHEAMAILAKVREVLSQEYTLRQNSNKGAGTFPQISVDSEPVMYEPIPTPSREMAEAFKEEHDRITRDPVRRYHVATVNVKAPALSRVAQDGLDF